MKWLLVLLVTGCTAPTLQQRQDDWRKYQNLVRSTCAIGKKDPAMPTEVKAWCAEVEAP